MDLSEAALVATCLSALTSIGLAAFAYFTLLAYREAVRHAATSATVQAGEAAGVALSDLVAREYLDRRFSSTSPPEIGGKRVESLREARRQAIVDRLSNAAQWAHDSGLHSRTWHNNVAFELSVAIQRVGLYVFTGIVPARVLAALAADQVLEDWLLCRDWITEYRVEHSPHSEPASIAYHRRHAEWLVFLCALWMHRTFPDYPSLVAVLRVEGGVEKVRARFAQITSLELALIPPSVRSEIDMLAGTSFAQQHGGAGRP